MKAMVTGGDGFVGKHLTEYLGMSKKYMCGVYDLQNGFDITDKDQVDWFFESFKPNVVYHLAGQIYANKSEEDRQKDWKINVLGTLNIIDAMIKYGVNVLVFASSDAARTPISNYGVSKRTAEEYILKYTRQGMIQGKIARFSSVYGKERGRGGAINNFVYQTLEEKPITVYKGALGTTRDFTHVTDVVRALQIIERDGHIGEVYNVGTGVQHSVNDVAYLIRDIVNGILLEEPLIQVEHIEGGQADTTGSDFDTTPLAKLGFVSKIDLYKGVDRVITEIFSDNRGKPNRSS